MKLKTIICTIALLLGGLGVNQLSAQNTNNYANVKVDELSDAQVRQFIQRAESIGYTDAQLEQMAAAQGMKAEEVQKLRARVEKIRKLDSGNQASNSQTDAENTNRKYEFGSKQDSLSNKKTQLDKAFEDLKPKIFGAELFKNSNITFEPNLRMATPKSYIIGPDDELLIDLTGDNEASYRLKVSPEGTIRLQYVGIVSVAGLSVEQATSKIRSSMSNTYPALGSGRTQLAINLGNIRSIKVILNGAIVKPGAYTLPSLATIFNALYASGGPNENGSFRNIQLIRNNKVVSTIDVYDFLLNGTQKGNIRLQDQDVINVPVYQTRVEVVGEVKRPALFEAVQGDSFQNILNFAGGFSTQAYTGKVKVFQNTAKERRITDIFADDFKVYKPKNGDKFFVEAILNRFENRVEILGAVFRPGVYELEKGLTLKGLLHKADGLKEDAFLNRGYIVRLNADNSQALLSFDVAKIMDGSQTDIQLQREDKVTISSIFDLKEEYKVTIQGEVRQGGTFDYSKNMSLEDLIQIAGGFKEGATPSRIEISRRIKNSDAKSASASTAQVFTVNVDQNLKLQGERFTLQPFDIVSVRNSAGYQIQKQVKLEGEVLYPGTYTITKKDERISDLIKRAGGLTPLAYAEGASLKRPGPDIAKDKNAIDKKQEEEQRLLNLKRLQQSGAKDTVSKEELIKVVSSDLVGISLEKILKKPASKYDLIVEDGDIIRVPKQLQTVKVTGEVLKPNSIVYTSSKGFKQYVNGAGGFTYNAYKKGVFVTYANGSVESVKRFLFFNNYPQIKPGAEISVPKRAERERMTAQGWIGIATATASLAAIIVSLLR